ncbi:hypothetical protein [Actinoplanes utahensis]|nr:hypothetical protein [Actinoplanes utahensis]GIF33484.1 hypothetical protein Aut01nite_64700 [Actinoplanes utahensis]
MVSGLKIALVVIVVLCGVVVGLLAERTARNCGCSEPVALSWGGGSFIAVSGLGMAILNMLAP